MKRFLALSLVCLMIAGCGSGTMKVASSSPAEPSRVVVPGRSHIYLNDGDGDPVGDEARDGFYAHDNKKDDDNDAPWDYKTGPDENRRYHDGDDRYVLSYGRSADAASRRAIAVVVRRYYAAAAAGNGARACSMLAPMLASSVVHDYGQLGPAYLHSGHTCPSIMRLLFEHQRSELRAPVTVTTVRVGANSAYALLGSRTLPASYISLQRLNHTWIVGELLGSRLP